ncbi:hypothetical protein M427DRAFT_353135 [Gonapodya prolifera JEL478]|uniref:Uncharacterized protein n=1 Tax=Gonapodya prolifera (strain JEL478) TaxID=1344416 RepID=A0A139ABX3_GONPJ|nr:hypothetical protein M427DRAFT_353135 [Gonapodya prolifera JEL478]|eukprot:KXS14296.1 hypothetical protein M427DRAFT_353135 [Gonapodya prolifera JEL478]
MENDVWKREGMGDLRAMGLSSSVGDMVLEDGLEERERKLTFGGVRTRNGHSRSGVGFEAEWVHQTWKGNHVGRMYSKPKVTLLSTPTPRYSAAHGYQRHLLARHFNHHLFLPKDKHGHAVPGFGTDSRVTVRGNGYGPNNVPFVRYDEKLDEGTGGFHTDRPFDTVTMLSDARPPQPIPSVPRSVNLVGSSAFTLAMVNVERDVKHSHGWSPPPRPAKPDSGSTARQTVTATPPVISETAQTYNYKGYLKGSRVNKGVVVEVAQFSGTGYTNDSPTLAVSQWEQDPGRFTDTQGFPLPPVNNELPPIAVPKKVRDVYAKHPLVHMDEDGYVRDQRATDCLKSPPQNQPATVSSTHTAALPQSATSKPRTPPPPGKHVGQKTQTSGAVSDFRPNSAIFRADGREFATEARDHFTRHRIHRASACSVAKEVPTRSGFSLNNAYKQSGKVVPDAALYASIDPTLARALIHRERPFKGSAFESIVRN